MGLNELGLDNVATHWNMSAAFNHYALFVAMFALGAGFVFFLSQKESVLPAYRGTMTTSAMICGVAAVAYFFLLREYQPGKPFPTIVRYVDWTVTTPLLLLKYPEMLKVRGTRFAWKLIIADLFMIVTGFIGELYGSTTDGHWTPNIANGANLHYLWGAISTVGYVVILYFLLTEGTRLAKTQPEPIQHGVKSLNMYIWSLWGVYPLAFMAECWSMNPAWNMDWFNIASSVADVINKVGFGVTAYLAVKALSGDDLEREGRVNEYERAGAR